MRIALTWTCWLLIRSRVAAIFSEWEPKQDIAIFFVLLPLSLSICSKRIASRTCQTKKIQVYGIIFLLFHRPHTMTRCLCVKNKLQQSYKFIQGRWCRCCNRKSLKAGWWRWQPFVKLIVLLLLWFYGTFWLKKKTLVKLVPENSDLSQHERNNFRFFGVVSRTTYWPFTGII